MSMPLPKLPIWMDGEKAQGLRSLSIRWWEQCLTWLQSPLTLGDALTAPLAIVDLLAYQRDIERYPSEPERLYRLRVHHALINARDAGTRAGMERIFTRLEMPVYGLAERLAGYDWDMIKVEATLADYLQAADALHIVMSAYRRTCRRWLLEVQAPTLTSNEKLTSVGSGLVEPLTPFYVAKHTSVTVGVGSGTIDPLTPYYTARNTSAMTACGLTIMESVG